MEQVATTIEAAESVTVRWTEAGCFPAENVDMSVDAFRALLSRIRRECEEEMCGAYCKVAFLAGGKSYRIDVTDDPRSIDLGQAWLY